MDREEYIKKLKIEEKTNYKDIKRIYNIRYCSRFQEFEDRKFFMNYMWRIDPVYAVLLMKENKKDKDAYGDITQEVFLPHIGEFFALFDPRPDYTGQYEKLNHYRKSVIHGMAALICIFEYLDKDQIIQILSKQFPFLWRSKFYAGYLAYAYQMLAELENCNQGYARIMHSLSMFMDDNGAFALSVERNLQGLEIRYSQIEATQQEAYEYLKYLCELHNYSAAAYFFKRIENNNIQLFGVEEETLKQLMCSCESERFVYYYLNYRKNQDETEYNVEQWIKDIKKYNDKEALIKWADTYQLFYNLKRDIDEEQFDVINFWNDCRDLGESDSFDISQVDYINNMAGILARVTNYIIEHDMDLLYFLEVLGNNNLFDFKLSALTNALYRDYIDLADYQKIKNKLFERFNSTDVLRIYMNTHLKYCIEIRDIVEYVALAKEGEGQINLTEEFAPYPLIGYVDSIDRKSKGHGKFMFHLNYIYTQYTYKNASMYTKQDKEAGLSTPSSQTKRAYNLIMRNEDQWYYLNKTVAMNLKKRDLCTFYIHSYTKGEEWILVDRIEKVVADRREEQLDRDHICKNLLLWLKEIQKNSHFIDWDDYCKEHNLDARIVAAENMEQREELALEILKTVMSLLDHAKELQLFLFEMVTGNLKEINEYRYIKTQSKRQKYRYEHFNELREEAKIHANVLIYHPDITAEQKLIIYNNTLLKTFYQLEIFIKKLNRPEILSTLNIIENDEVSGWLIPVNYKKTENGMTYFNENEPKTVFTHYDFVLEEEWVGEARYYYATMKKMDWERRCFIIDKLYTKEELDQDPWRLCMYVLYDLKKSSDHDYMEKQREKVENCRIDFHKGYRFKQFAYEMNLVFKKYAYNLDICSDVMDVIEQINPFVRSEYEELMTELGQDPVFHEACQSFLDANKDQSVSRLYRIYMTSFFHCVFTEDQFRENVMEWCKEEEYISAKNNYKIKYNNI